MAEPTKQKDRRAGSGRGEGPKTFRLGLFIVSTLSMLAVGSFLIGARQFLFTPTYPLKSTFPTVSGLIKGSEVRMGGMQEGVVKDIQLPDAPGGAVTIVMALARSTRNVVRSDSVASIATEGLLGNKYVEISFGSPGAAAIEEWSTLKGAPAVDIADVVKKADGVLADVKGSTAQLKGITAKAGEGAAAFSDNMDALKHNFLLKGYFDKRGYEDSAALTEHLITRLPRDTAMKTFHYEARKVFNDAEHAKLRDEKTFDEAGRFLERYPFGLAVVVANSGSVGDTQELHTLLQARAMVVRDYLVKHFKMNDLRVKTMEIPKGPNATDDAGSVDIVVYPTAVKPPASAGR